MFIPKFPFKPGKFRHCQSPMTTTTISRTFFQMVLQLSNSSSMKSLLPIPCVSRSYMWFKAWKILGVLSLFLSTFCKYLHVLSFFLGSINKSRAHLQSERANVSGEAFADVAEYRFSLQGCREIWEKKCLSHIYRSVLLHQDIRVQGQQHQSF